MTKKITYLAASLINPDARMRIGNEEKVLEEGLQGYKEYKKKGYKQIYLIRYIFFCYINKKSYLQTIS